MGIKISALSAVPSAQLTDVFPVVQGGTTYKESLSQVSTLFQSVFLPLAGGTMAGNINLGSNQLTNGSLATSVQVPVGSLNNGTSASNTTFWRGDGTWSTPGGGGSSPWSAGSGTGSAIGGDGSTTAAGNYSLSYGSSGSTAAANNQYTLGNSLTVTAKNSLFVGSTMSGGGGSAESCVGLGDRFTFGNFPYQICMGTFNNLNGLADIAIGTSVNLSANFNIGIGYSITLSGVRAIAIGNYLTAANQGANVFGDSQSYGNKQSNADDALFMFFNGGHNFYVNNATLAASIDTAGNVINNLGEVDGSYNIVAPSTGGTVNLATTHRRVVINPASTLATLTVNMPASPVNGQLQTFSFTQIVTALTVSGNGNSILGAPSSAAIANAFTFIYNTGTTTWYPT